ncbi:Hsp70 family protein [Collimonas sp.]|jgi:hypothetical chaperone protein|uniref:Hsp70 family protein n=1 Tax=Collimonas sp. TaxID=1963772 RepID=UPI0037C0A589
MSFACGVDFGTSNSTVGWSRPGHDALLPLEDGKVTLPSVVFFNAEDEAFSFGRAALSGYLTGYEGRLMRSLKSLLGSSLIDAQTEVGGRALPFRALLTHFIGELKARAETAAGREFDSVVLGRPVFFVDDNPAADQRAEDTLAEIARSVGFKDIAFQYEPIAAAFDYESTITREELVLIADIGGTDFDKYLSLSSVMPMLGLGSRLRNNSEVPSSYYFNLATWHTINQIYTRKAWQQLKDVQRETLERDKFDRLLDLVEQRAGHWLALQVEQGKIGLSDADTIQLSLDRIAPQQTLQLTREQFNDSIGHLVGSVENTVNNLLRDAGVSAAQVDTVFFTGGSSGVQLLRDKIAALVPSAKAVEGDLFGSIGAGLALDAVRKFG